MVIKGVVFMKQRKIMLPSISAAKEFVKEAGKCDFDIDVFYNRVIIDAKSLLGVLSLDLTRVLTVEYNGENEEFEELLDELEKNIAVA
jgi:PTS HPr component phosphorylation site